MTSTCTAHGARPICVGPKCWDAIQGLAVNGTMPAAATSRTKIVPLELHRTEGSSPCRCCRRACPSTPTAGVRARQISEKNKGGPARICSLVTVWLCSVTALLCTQPTFQPVSDDVSSHTGICVAMHGRAKQCRASTRYCPEVEMQWSNSVAQSGQAPEAGGLSCSTPCTPRAAWLSRHRHHQCANLPKYPSRISRAAANLH